MMEDNDIERSRGEKSASDVDELESVFRSCYLGGERRRVPHSHEILHHELVQRFCWMCHIHLALSVPEVRVFQVLSRDPRRERTDFLTFSVMYVKAAAWSR